MSDFAEFVATYRFTVLGVILLASVGWDLLKGIFHKSFGPALKLLIAGFFLYAGYQHMLVTRAEQVKHIRIAPATAREMLNILNAKE